MVDSYKTKSYCPQCLKKIDADIVQKKGKIILKKKFRAVTVIEKKTGREIADVVSYGKGEKVGTISYLKKYGTVMVGGIRLIHPKARLESRIAQLRMYPKRKIETTRKTIRDIETLTRERGFALRPKKQSLLSYKRKKLGGFKWF